MRCAAFRGRGEALCAKVAASAAAAHGQLQALDARAACLGDAPEAETALPTPTTHSILTGLKAGETAYQTR